MTDDPRLIDTPDDPVPAGAEPGWVIAGDGLKLRAALFPATAGRPRGTVVLSGGRTEPIEKYFETIGDFRARGFAVLAHDWRGQGLSGRELPDRLKGHARGWRPFLDDFRRMLDAYEARLPKPWIAVGHSMGGCLTLLALAQGERRFAGAVLCAPMLGLQTGGVSPLAARALTTLNLMLGRANRYALGQPGAPYDDTFEGNALTHDAARFARYRAQVRVEPSLALGSPTYGWIDFALRATAELARPGRLSGVTIPVDIVSATDDKLVDNAAQARAARNLPQGRIIPAPGAFHEVLMETDDMRNIFLRVFDALTGKTAPKPAEAPAPVAAAPEPVAAVTPEPAPPPPQAKAAPKPKAAPKAKAATKAKAEPDDRPVPVPKAAKAAAKPKAAPKPAAKAAPTPKTAKPAAAKPAAAKAKPAPNATAKPKAAAKPVAKPAAKASPAAVAKPKAPSKPKAPAKAAAKPKAAKPKA